MKTITLSIITCFFLLNTFFCNAQAQLKMSMLSTWKDNTNSLPVNSYVAQYNDCWGYVDPAGREYAIIGSTMGTHIFNITNPASPKLVSFQKGKEASSAVVHRDFKTYEHYLYAVCDEGNSSLQIFDLKYLPDSVHKVYDSQSICRRAHNIFIDNKRLYFAGLSDINGKGITLRVASLANPENPVIIKDLVPSGFTYVHDVFVRRDTAFLSSGNPGLFIYNYTNASAPVLIGSLTNYPEQGYNHSSWVTADGKTLVFADETHGKGLKVYDISDMQNIQLKSIFRSNLLNDPAKQSVPHNPFILGNKVFISYYHDGVQCFDISNTASPKQVAYYDTHPSSTNYSGFGPGCWGVYPFLPSRRIIGSDMANGLFILDGSQVLGVDDDKISQPDFLVSPNPASQVVSITSNEPNNGKLKIEMYDNLGNRILSVPAYTSGEPIDISRFSPGIYLVNIYGNSSHLAKKIIKTN